MLCFVLKHGGGGGLLKFSKLCLSSHADVEL